MKTKTTSQKEQVIEIYLTTRSSNRVLQCLVEVEQILVNETDISRETWLHLFEAKSNLIDAVQECGRKEKILSQFEQVGFLDSSKG